MKPIEINVSGINNLNDVFKLYRTLWENGYAFHPDDVDEQSTDPINLLLVRANEVCDGLGIDPCEVGCYATEINKSRWKTLGEIWNQANLLFQENIEMGESTDLRTKRGRQLKSREILITSIAIRYYNNAIRYVSQDVDIDHLFVVLIDEKMCETSIGFSTIWKDECLHIGGKVSSYIYSRK